ncbi:hypothetical protein PR048_020055 [Dryococelus australis]|uniref:Uncharacterized protein n=1 Tax=Dryococelus australis TaxID=614101 RepID=A0ABQ9H5C3_9NEOP|nr:hypothetical protein PR048_020055 [Dryococelus australis]
MPGSSEAIEYLNYVWLLLKILCEFMLRVVKITHILLLLRETLKRHLRNMKESVKHVVDALSLQDIEQEKYRLIEAAAKIIKTDLKLLPKLLDTCPSASDIASTERNEDLLPPSLWKFLDVVSKRSESKDDTLKKKIKKTIGQAMIGLQVCRPRSLISPILLGIGFASRGIVDVLYKFGFSVSYDEMQRFVKSSVVNEDQTVTLPPGHFCQWVGDNIDHNIATIDGHNIFHGMGIIMCSTGSSKSIFLGHSKPIIRSNSPRKASEVLEKAHTP